MSEEIHPSQFAKAIELLFLCNKRSYAIAYEPVGYPSRIRLKASAFILLNSHSTLLSERMVGIGAYLNSLPSELR